MNFLTMEYFAALIREKNFTRAAKKLHITQQTLSAHIASLEKECGCQLLVRSVPLELTYAGKVFYRHAVDFQSNMQDLKRELQDINTEQAGELHIGVAPMRERILLPELIASYRKRYPLVTFCLLEEPNAILQQKLLNGEIDLAIAYFPNRIANIKIEPFYCEKIVLLLKKSLLVDLFGGQQQVIVEKISQGDKKALAKLNKCPFLLNGDSNIAGRMGRDLLAAANIEPAIAALSNNMETLLELCVLGVGAMFCPENLARHIVSQDKLVELEFIPLPDTDYEISFGLKAGQYSWDVIERFIDAARTTCL